jgi:hypothetical protein
MPKEAIHSILNRIKLKNGTKNKNQPNIRSTDKHTKSNREAMSY